MLTELNMLEMLAILMFFLAAGLTPGPLNILLFTSGAAFGLRPCLPMLVGATLGLNGVLLLSIFSASVLTQASGVLRQLFMIIGLAYIVYLAFKIIKVELVSSERVGAIPSFWDVLLLQMFNPKAWILLTAFSASYIPPSITNADLLLIAWIASLTGFVTMGAYPIVGAGLRSLCVSPTIFRCLTFGSAGLLLCSVASALLVANH